MELIEQAGVRALSWHDSDYPAALKEIYDPPPVLFCKGGFAPEMCAASPWWERAAPPPTAARPATRS